MWPWRRSGRRRFSAGAAGELDLEMSPPYVTDHRRLAEERAHVERLIVSLTGGLDAGSREVLNNLINDYADQALADLQRQRDNRLAVNDILEGLARQEVARRKPRYEADLAEVQQAGVALAVTFRELTGLDLDEVKPPRPPDPDLRPLESTLGPLDASDKDGHELP
jgi:hypothetical protein